MAGMTLGNMIDDIMEAEIIAHMMRAYAFADDYQVPVDDAGIGEPLFEAGPLFPEDLIPAVPLQEIPPQEAEANVDADDLDPADFVAAPDDQPEDPPVIVIDSDDDDEEDVEEELVEEWEDFEGIDVDMEDAEDDPDEILFDDGDWDVDSDASSVPPVEPQVPEVQQGVPRNFEVPLAPAGIPVNPPVVREDLLYEQFRRIKTPEFEGPTDPIAVDNWLIDIQMTVQMRRYVTTMSWQDFVTEFRTMYYNKEILAAQQDEFMSLRQGSMTVMEAVKKFEQLARLCPELVPTETEKVRRMMKMFRIDIAKQVSTGSSPSTLVSDCVSRAIRAEYWINQDKEARAQIFKAKKEEKAIVKPMQPRQSTESYPKGQNSNPAQSYKQFGRNKIKGNFTGQCVEWGRTLATFMARRGIMQGIAL
ncbi:hypothetical protein TIFTF001_033357 [Ficus carica]|uniref:Retrotransposon gag domain-containing protein n=1 Tax=Ficus carica TaxID=3494 RepID=A0AA88DYD7_FICCA|nr:hypothetical protein TIFTF001_033357 [Ficus carica]